MRIQQKGDLADKSAKSTDKDWDSIAGMLITLLDQRFFEQHWT